MYRRPEGAVQVRVPGLACSSLHPGDCFELFGEGGEVGVGGQHRGRGQVPPSQRGGPGGLGPAFDPGLAQGLFLAPAGGGGVGGQHRAAGRGAQLPGGLAGGGADDRLLHRGGVLAGEAGELLGDDLGAGRVDVPGGQRGPGGGQAAQRDGELQDAGGGPPGQR